jgi:hypothetical protein
MEISLNVMQYYSKLNHHLFYFYLSLFRRALNEDQYNHITATYYLLAEKILHDRLFDKTDDIERNAKRQRRLQPASDPFTEQIGVFMPSSTTK